MAYPKFDPKAIRSYRRSMSEHKATVRWQRGDSDFLDKKYSRAHEWEFDGGMKVKASAAPEAVRPPMSDPSAVDPEEAFIAALSSCHMLWFLAIAAKEKFRVDRYEDQAVGVMAKNSAGKMAIVECHLKPVVTFSGDRKPTEVDIRSLHEKAHQECYIANSVTARVVIE
jgi:organic hydroperoxide reductase OsmC/OhrA